MRDIGLSRDDLWLIKENGTFVQRSDYGPIDASTSMTKSFTLSYRGSEPIIVAGIYLRPMEDEFYTGSGTPAGDVQEILEWAANSIGGVTVDYVDFNDVPVSTLLTFGNGSSRSEPANYTGHRNGILGRGSEIDLTVKIEVPAGLNQLREPASYNWRLDVVWSEFSLFLAPDGFEGDSC